MCWISSLLLLWFISSFWWSTSYKGFLRKVSNFSWDFSYENLCSIIKLRLAGCRAQVEIYFSPNFENVPHLFSGIQWSHWKVQCHSYSWFCFEIFFPLLWEVLKFFALPKVFWNFTVIFLDVSLFYSLCWAFSGLFKFEKLCPSVIENILIYSLLFSSFLKLVNILNVWSFSFLSYFPSEPSIQFSIFIIFLTFRNSFWFSECFFLKIAYILCFFCRCTIVLFLQIY